MTTFLFEFVYSLKQEIYTQLVVICGQQNYQLDTKHAIDGVVAEGMREGEVRGLIPNNCVTREFCAKNAATYDLQKWGGWGGPNKNNFFNYF